MKCYHDLGQIPRIPTHRGAPHTGAQYVPQARTRDTDVGYLTDYTHDPDPRISGDALGEWYDRLAAEDGPCV